MAIPYTNVIVFESLSALDDYATAHPDEIKQLFVRGSQIIAVAKVFDDDDDEEAIDDEE
jgi:hypothetical protein